MILNVSNEGRAVFFFYFQINIFILEKINCKFMNNSGIY